MCLSEVTSNTHDPAAAGGGWKAFVLEWGSIHSWFCWTEAPYEINEWYEAFDFRTSDRMRYWRGFHLFTKRQYAELWAERARRTVVRQVRWRHLLAKGFQRVNGLRLPVIVAKEILILPEKQHSRRPPRTAEAMS